MPDRYDPKLSVRKPGDRRPSEEAQVPKSDDPLVELARMVSSRPNLGGSAQKGNSVSESERDQSSGASPDQQPLPSEADLAADLEAELLNELQASFSMVPEVVGNQPAPENRPPPVEPVRSQEPKSVQQEVTVSSPLPPETDFEAAFRLPTQPAEDDDDGFMSGPIPASIQPQQPVESVAATRPAVPVEPKAPSGSPANSSRNSLAARIARAAQGGSRPDARSGETSTQGARSAARTTPQRPNNPQADTRSPSPDDGGAQFRPTMLPGQFAEDAVESTLRSLPSRWDTDQDTPPSIDASRFAPVQSDPFRPEGQEPSNEPDVLAEGFEFPTTDDEYFDEAAENEDFNTVPGYDDELSAYPDDDAAALEPPRSRRGPLAIAALLVVAVVAGTAVILFRSSGTDSPPPIITADGTPTKVTPDETGTSDADGQSKLIYDRVDPGSEIADSQLVVPGGDPIADIPSIPGDNGSSGVSRVILEGGPVPNPSEAGSDAFPVQDNAADAIPRSGITDVAPAEPIGPKKVRTVVVRPDGTIVSSEAVPADADGNSDPAATDTGILADLPPASETPPAPAANENPLLGDNFGVEPVVVPAPTAPVPSVPAQAPASVSVPDISPPSSTPTPRPAAPSPTVVATPGSARGPIDVTPANPPGTQQGLGGGFLVQVSSQRSQETALASFGELQRRYPGILGDRAPNIQRADLGQRGIYYRVRVGYPTREEAVRMCQDLKAAGGDCLLATR